MAFLEMIKTTIRTLLTGPVTRRYPSVPAKVTERTRGHVTIDPSECILCGLCMRRCPSDAIVVEREERTWQIDRSRCIVCGSCVESCPAKCLTMENSYIPPEDTRPEPESVAVTSVRPEKKGSAPEKDT
ncbi:MAG: 4Fe-4S binding protein [Methanoculleaceae archaeon]